MTTSLFYGHMSMGDKLPYYMHSLDYPSNPDTKQEKTMEHHSTASSLSLASEMENTFISTLPISTSCNTTRFLNQPVTNQQELYAQGFLDALKQIHKRSEHESQPVSNVYSQSNAMISSYGPNPSLPNVANTYATAATSVIPAHLERTLYNTPESGTSSPYSSHEDLRIVGAPYHMGTTASMNCSSANSESDIYNKPNGLMGHHEMFRDAMAVVPDMTTQEQLKSERKKARNRVAATKCRQKRLAREASQQEKVIQLKTQYNQLQSQRVALKESIEELKKQLNDHLRKGCQIDLPKITNSRKRAPSRSHSCI